MKWLKTFGLLPFITTDNMWASKCDCTTSCIITHVMAYQPGYLVAFMNIFIADTSKRRVSHMFFYFRFEQGQLIEGRCWVVLRFLLIRSATGTWNPVSTTEKQEPLLPAGSRGGEHSGPPARQFSNTAAAEYTFLPLQVTCRS